MGYKAGHAGQVECTGREEEREGREERVGRRGDKGREGEEEGRSSGLVIGNWLLGMVNSLSGKREEEEEKQRQTKIVPKITSTS